MLKMKGMRFPKEIILPCVHGYAACPLSYRNLEEVMHERSMCVGSVALATDEREFGGDECQFLRRDGFSLPMHKTCRQKTSRCSPPS